MKTINVIQQELKKEYPSGIVSNLKLTNEELYNKIRDYAKSNNTSVKDLLESNDFIYLRKSIIRMYVEDFIELEKAYPEYIVTSFYEKNNKLYYRVLSHAKSVKVSMRKYLNSLGFQYVSREEVTNDSIKNELVKLYGGNKVTNLSAKDTKLYYRVYQLAKKENKTVAEYIKGLGLTIEENEENDKKTKKTTNKNKTTDTQNSTKKEKTDKTESKKETETSKTEPKKRGRKPKENKETASKTETKKRGRKPNTNKETTTKTETKKRGRKPKTNNVNTEPKKRGRKPKTQNIETVIEKEANA